jgi:hypothetical protein
MKWSDCEACPKRNSTVIVSLEEAPSTSRQVSPDAEIRRAFVGKQATTGAGDGVTGFHPRGQPTNDAVPKAAE